MAGRFFSYPGIRLYGEAGEPRPATQDELDALRKRIGGAHKLKGSRMIWSGLQTARDIQITEVAPVRYPRMMEHLD